MQHLDIGFIGAGNMGSCLIRGLLAHGHDPERIWATNSTTKQLEGLGKLSIHTSTDNRFVVTQVSVLVLAVKPQSLKQVVADMADLIREKKPLLISIAAAVNVETLQSYVQDETIAIIRCMPNTPALLGCGATGLFANQLCSSSQKEIAELLFRSVGIVVWTNSESEIDSIAALSGSGPAYFFSFIHALRRAGLKLGLSQEVVDLLSSQTAMGAARMVLECRQSVEELQKNVTSPGGTTEEALRVFEQGHFSDLVEQAVLAAKQRAVEMAKRLQHEGNPA